MTHEREPQLAHDPMHRDILEKLKASNQANMKAKKLTEGLFDYLQALCPYASISQLSEALRSTDDVEKAARCIYDAHHPDISSFRCLEREWDLKRSAAKEADLSQRVHPFEGVDLLLTNRAREIFRRGHFDNLSLTRDYNYTVRVFPVDTSEWDREMLLKPRPLQDVAYKRLILANEEETTAAGSTTPRRGTSPQKASSVPGENTPQATKGLGKMNGPRVEGLPIAPIIRWLAGFSVTDFSSFQHRPPKTETVVLNNLFSPKIIFYTSPSKVDKVELRNDTGKKSEKVEVMRSPVLGRPGTLNGPPSSDSAERAAARSSLTFSRDEGISHSHEISPFPLNKDDEASGPLSVGLFETKQANGSLLEQTQSTSLLSEDFRSNHRSDSSVSEKNSRTESLLQVPAEEAKSGAPQGTTNEDAASPLAQPARKESGTLGLILSQGSENVAFLIEEEKHWKSIAALRGRLSSVFRGGSKCDLVREISIRCPLFVEQADAIMKALLQFLSKETPGWRLAQPLEEVSVRIPFLGRKLLSTSEFKVKELEFDQSKSSCEFIDDGMRLKIRIYISKLCLFPIQFSYIGESNANRQNRRLRNGTHFCESGVCAYTKGVTHGELGVKVCRVNLILFTKMMIPFRGSPEALVEDSVVSIKSLKLSNSVAKLNVLYVFLKPFITSIVEKGLRDAIIGSHAL